MYNVQTDRAPTNSQIQHKIAQILETITNDWDLDFTGPITAETKLIEDLEFQSMDIVQLVVAIENEFDDHSIPFDQLFVSENRYVDDLSVAQVAEFLAARFRAH